ncbi:MAG: four helix bundle protein, partial [Candidatus Zambryskibacteria bacterium]|nr:four helix bundle protein [Candidatus Zambryskibacteria bacterium]
KEKEAYLLWVKAQRNFPKVERLGLGVKIDQNFLFVLEYTFISAYLPMTQKVLGLSKVISKLDLVKFFMQMAWEIKLIPNEKYIEISQKLEEIGRDSGSWKKSIEIKLPPKNDGRN